MNASDRLLRLCARQRFLPEHRAAVERLCAENPIDWPRLLAAAEPHRLLPLLAFNLRGCDRVALRLPQHCADLLELALLENIARRQHEAHRLEEALLALRQVGLEAMLVKGTALPLRVYEQPWFALSGDLDLSLRPLAGWKEREGQERQVRARLYRSGFECDLHGHHDVTMNGVLPIDFARIWRDAKPVRCGSADAWVMDDEDLLISLCINACRKRYFRLKCLFDIAEALDRLGPLDWARVGARARAGACQGIVYAALVAARAAVGAQVTDEQLQQLAVSPSRAALLRALLAGFLRWGSLEHAARRTLALPLVFASLGPWLGLRSLWHKVAHPRRRRGRQVLSPN